MNQKQIGYIVIAFALLLGLFVYSVNENEEAYVNDYVESEGTCFTDEGVCLHDQKSSHFYLGLILVVALGTLGSSFPFCNKTCFFFE